MSPTIRNLTQLALKNHGHHGTFLPAFAFQWPYCEFGQGKLTAVLSLCEQFVDLRNVRVVFRAAHDFLAHGYMTTRPGHHAASP